MQAQYIHNAPDLEIDTSHEPLSSAKVILGALQHKAIYQGTVAPVVKKKRRAANKAAGASRKKNRK